jgi:predicted membrane protein
MYAALWRVLPGPWWLRVLILIVALAVLIFVLVEWVFPWVQTFVAPQDVTVQK